MRRQAGLAFLVALAAACADRSPPRTVDREVFIEAYVDLRLAALRAPDFVVSPEQRAQILERHGVDAEELLAFARAYGGDVEFMSEVWNEVERRLEARRTEEAPSP